MMRLRSLIAMLAFAAYAAAALHSDKARGLAPVVARKRVARYNSSAEAIRLQITGFEVGQNIGDLDMQHEGQMDKDRASACEECFKTSQTGCRWVTPCDEAVRHASAQHTMCQLLTGAPYSSGRVLVRRHESRVS